MGKGAGWQTGSLETYLPDKFGLVLTTDDGQVADQVQPIDLAQPPHEPTQPLFDPMEMVE